MAKTNPEEAPADVERECEAWDWARAAGVSAQELRAAVRQSLRGAEEQRPQRVAKAA